MSYFKILFDGNKYVTRSTFEQVFGYGWIDLSRRSLVLLETVIYGPITKKEEEDLEVFEPTVQDIGKGLRSFRLNPPHEKEFTIWKVPRGVKTYSMTDEAGNTFKFVKMTSIKNVSRYAQQHRMPVLYVGGKGLYIALNTKLRTAEKPIIITLA